MFEIMVLVFIVSIIRKTLTVLTVSIRLSYIYKKNISYYKGVIL